MNVLDNRSLRRFADQNPAAIPTMLGNDLEAVETSAPRRTSALTELVICIMLGMACADMCFGIFTLARAVIYAFAVLLALVGGGFKPRFTLAASLLLLAGGLYLLKALLYPPVPNLVRNDIRNILVGFAFLGTLGLSDLTREGWDHVHLRAHQTVFAVSAIGASLGLAKMIYYTQGGMIPFLADAERGYPLGSSLQFDYNFFSLPLLLGLVSAFWLLKRSSSSLWQTAAVLGLPILISGVLFSGSRRGLVTIVCAVPLLLAWVVMRRVGAPSEARRAGISWKLLAIALSLLAVVCTLKFDSLIQFGGQLTSADSFSEVLGRWKTFEEGTYSESRIHYWSITAQRLARLDALDLLFGEGFIYVTDLGADPELAEDYPHNFVLSSLLYGGIVQTACLLMMVGVTFARLLRGRQRASMFGCWFLLVILFLFTSSNSFFSSEIAVFLTVLGLGFSGRESGERERGIISPRDWLVPAKTA